MFSPSNFFDFSNEQVANIFEGFDYCWEPLLKLKGLISRFVGEKQIILGHVMEGAFISDNPMFIDENAIVEPGAYIIGPAYIGPGTIVRHGAYLRQDVIVLSNCVVGHATEIKSSILLPGSKAPHFNYVGDSIIGNRVNLGAGTKLSNLTILSEKDPITGKRPLLKFKYDENLYDTGLEKLGAIIGDEVETGCNAVLNPGCLVGPKTLIYANVSLRKGYYPPGKIIKLRQELPINDRL